MGRSQETFGKKEREAKRQKKKQDKARRKEERKLNKKEGGFDDMIAYVDEFGNLSDTPPDPTKKVKVDASQIEIGVPKREVEEYDPIRKGIVEFFNDSKGFGFIRDLEDQEKYFVHVSGLVDDVIEGNNVIFELERGRKGLNAVNVKKG